MRTLSLCSLFLLISVFGHDIDFSDEFCKCTDDSKQTITSSCLLGKVNSFLFDIWSEIIVYDQVMGWVSSETDEALQTIIKDVHHSSFDVDIGHSFGSILSNDKSNAETLFDFPFRTHS